MLRSILLVLVLSLPLTSFGRSLYCQASYNTEVLFETEVTLKDGEVNKLFGTLAGLQFYLSDKGENKIELQVFNTYEPSRNYAIAIFKEARSQVELAIWKQDYLLEAKCSN